MTATYEPGNKGQFDVLVGDDLVASKQKSGDDPKLFFGNEGFPEEADAVSAVRAKLKS